MASLIPSTRSVVFSSAFGSSSILNTVFFTLILGPASCAVREYTPPLLPTFMQEQTPAGHLPPEEQGTVQRPPSPSQESGTAPAVSVQPEHESVGPSALPLLSAVTQEGGTSSVSSPVQHSGLTLDQVIRTVLEADPKIRVGWEAVNQAKADLLTSSLPPNPGMLVDSIFVPFGKPFTVQKPGGPTQIDVGGNYPIDAFLFGKRAAAITSARLGVDVSAADFADLVRQRVAGAIAAFYDVLEANALFELAQEDLADLQRVEAITSQRVALGGVGTIELDRIRLAIFDSQRDVRSRDTALTAARAQLQAFLGFRASDPRFAIQGSLAVPTPAPPPGAKEMLALAEQTRPDLISLRRQLAKAEADLRVEQTRAYPSITPQLAWTRQFQPGVPDVSSFAPTVNFSLPLFDRNQGNIAKARSARLQTTFTIRAQLVSLQAEIAQTVKAYQAAYVTVTTDDPAQLQAATNVRDKIKLAYELGGRPLIEVLDAQRAYRDTYRSYITGRSNYWHTLHSLNAAIGRQVLQ